MPVTVKLSIRTFDSVKLLGGGHRPPSHAHKDTIIHRCGKFDEYADSTGFHQGTKIRGIVGPLQARERVIRPGPQNNASYVSTSPPTLLQLMSIIIVCQSLAHTFNKNIQISTYKHKYHIFTPALSRTEKIGCTKLALVYI